MEQNHNMKYGRFFVMIGVSMVVMFALMYMSAFSLDHVLFSETRFWMTFVMGASMAIIMLSFMKSMFSDRRKNMLILAGSVTILCSALYLVRSQQTVSEVGFMRAMTPHHSIAILTAERSHLRDPRVRKLAKEIIDAQRREIAEMKYLIAEIERDGVLTTTAVGR